MAIHSRLIPIPDKKVSYKKGKNGTLYVYFTTRAYRRKKDGQPTSDEVCIGKKDPKSGMLVPNKKYLDMFGTIEDFLPGMTSRIFGSGYILKKKAEVLGITRIVQQVFPRQWQEILLAASYMVLKGNVMMYLDDFCEMYVTDTQLDSQGASELFASLSEAQMNAFFVHWTAKVQEQEYLAYDVTSISSYSEQMEEVEYGYNRDGENLPQLNIGMFYGEQSQRPVYYMLYSGSIPDKTHLEYMLRNANQLGIHRVTFVMDRGFATQENIDYFMELPYSLILCLPAGQKIFTQLVESVSASIKSAAHWIPGHDLYGVKVTQSVYGRILDVHIFYSLELELNRRKELHDYVGRLEKELSEMCDKKKNYRRFERFFNITATGDRTIQYEMNPQKVDEVMKTAGFFAFATDRTDLTPNQLLTYYRHKDGIEKVFHHSKNDLDFSRLKTHYTETTNGKYFVGFIALILYCDILNQIKSGPKEISKMTVKKVLLQMDKIRVMSSSREDRSYLLNPLTKKQKDILRSLALNPDEFLEEARNLNRIL
jgi:transposase